MIEEQVFENEKVEMKGETFSGCVFRRCDFTEKDMEKARLQTCKFKECNFTATKVLDVRFQSVCFVGCKVMGVDFTVCDPTFLSLSFEKCLMQGCNFSGLKMKGPSFAESKVRECFFTEANLEKGDFREADLEGSFFHHTNLAGANFTGATNYRMSPMDNTLTKAKFSQLEALNLLEDLGILLVD